MNYYPFNIGDYRRQTTHLSLLEHGIYRSLLDTYYLNESPLCADDAKLMRTHCIRTEEEKSAFANVLADFFTKTECGYLHSSCEKVIEKYKEKSEKASRSAKARWGKDANAVRTHSEGNANQEPITNNQEPIKDKKPRKAQLAKPENVSQQVWDDFKALRKEKRAALTATALKTIVSESEKAGIPLEKALTICCHRGWQSFNHTWQWQDEIKRNEGNGKPRTAVERVEAACATDAHEQTHGQTLDQNDQDLWT